MGCVREGIQTGVLALPVAVTQWHGRAGAYVRVYTPGALKFHWVFPVLNEGRSL